MITNNERMLSTIKYDLKELRVADVVIENVVEQIKAIDSSNKTFLATLSEVREVLKTTEITQKENDRIITKIQDLYSSSKTTREIKKEEVISIVINSLFNLGYSELKIKNIKKELGNIDFYQKNFLSALSEVRELLKITGVTQKENDRIITVIQNRRNELLGKSRTQNSVSNTSKFTKDDILDAAEFVIDVSSVRGAAKKFIKFLRD